MTGVEDDVYVIDALASDLQIAERLLRVHILERNHVDRAHQRPLMVVGEERPRGEGGGIDVQGAEPGYEVRQRDERADFRVRAARWRRALGRRRVGDAKSIPAPITLARALIARRLMFKSP